MARKMDLWHSRLPLAIYGPALTTTGLITGIHVATTTCMPNFSLLALPTGQKMDPWHSGPDRAMSGLALTLSGLVIGFLVANTT